MDEILSSFVVLFVAAPRSPLGKTDLSVCVVCVCVFSHDWLHSPLLRRQRWIYDPKVPKGVLSPPRRVKRWPVDTSFSMAGDPTLTSESAPLRSAPNRKLIKVFAHEEVTVQK